MRNRVCYIPVGHARNGGGLSLVAGLSRAAARGPALPKVACCALLGLGLLSVGGLRAADRYDHVRVLGGDSLEGGVYGYELRCRDGSRRPATERWDLAAEPPRLLEVCASASGGEPRCKADSDVYAAAEWLCGG